MGDKKESHIKLGAIILNYNSFEDTIKCVESIIINSALPTVIYIVDNNSEDGSGDKLLKFYENQNGIYVIENKENRGYSAGNNIGIKSAESDGCNYIAIINSDVELLNDAFSIMVERLKNDQTIMMIGPSVIDANGNETQLLKKKLDFRLFVLGRHPFCDIPYFSRQNNRVYTNLTSHSMVFEGSVSGCCFLASIEDIKKISYLDENVFLYYEEDILAYKMERIGKKSAVEYAAKVVHKGGASTDNQGNAFIQFHRWTSVLYMLKEYASISYRQQLFIATWNILIWNFISIRSKKHRKIKKEFRKRNWEIIKK